MIDEKAFPWAALHTFYIADELYVGRLCKLAFFLWSTVANLEPPQGGEAFVLFVAFGDPGVIHQKNSLREEYLSPSSREFVSDSSELCFFLESFRVVSSIHQCLRAALTILLKYGSKKQKDYHRRNGERQD